MYACMCVKIKWLSLKRVKKFKELRLILMNS